MEQTAGGKIVNQAKTIFVFRQDQFDYLESNYQPFDTAKDAACRPGKRKADAGGLAEFELWEKLNPHIPLFAFEHPLPPASIQVIVFQRTN